MRGERVGIRGERVGRVSGEREGREKEVCRRGEESEWRVSVELVWRE